MKILRWLNENLEKVLAIAITVVMTAILFLQVLSRYVFNFSITWSEELAIFLLIWLTYLGSSLAITQRKHLRITILSDLLPEKGRKIVEILCNLVFAGFMIFLVVGSYHMMNITKRTGQTAAATGIPRWIIVCGMMLAFALAVLRLAQDTARQVREYREIGNKPDAERENAVSP